MKVVFTPFSVDNPYQRLLVDALSLSGIEVIPSKIFPKFFWLCKNRKSTQIIHIHWPSDLYRMGTLTNARAVVLFVRMVWALILGYRLVWTIHNILPHESTTPRLDVLFRKFLVFFGHGLISHCRYALVEIERRFGRPKKIITIPHGNYIGYYPAPPGRDCARYKLGIKKDSFVFLTFGLLRDYKGIGLLVDQLVLLDRELTLVVAGRGSLSYSLQESVKNTKVKLLPYCEFIADEDVPTFFAAADVIVAPYRNILTSGTVILGLSMGKPVVAPAIGCLPDLLADGSGILFDPSRPGALKRVLNGLFDADLRVFSRAAKEKAESLDWVVIGKATADFYTSLEGVDSWRK